MGLQETGWKGMEWIDLAQERDTWRTPCDRGNECLGTAEELLASQEVLCFIERVSE